ncbi:MAG: hypothetical protein H7338_22035 [Candidatus Sericytochromatia bacterium]|nr:hypothetical protein [Candidatus Sericytochromatia bacterium]
MRFTHKVLSLLLLGSVVVTTGCQVQPIAGAAARAPLTHSASLDGVTAGYRQVAQQMFDDMDGDRDGVLEAKELASFKAKGGETGQILTADRNLDGKVSRDEFMDPAYVTLIVDQVRFQMANMFTALDKDGDGFMSANELVVAKGPITNELFRKFDRNSNRKLGLSEFEDLIWVDLMPKSVNPLNQLQPNQFPQLPEAFSFTVVLANAAKIQTVMIKKDETSTPIIFLTRGTDPIPHRIIREFTPGGYSVTIKQTDGIATSRHIDATQATTVTVTANRNGPQIAVEGAAPTKAE